jgi:hypothetical protein
MPSLKTLYYLLILGLAIAPVAHAEKCVMKGTIYDNVWHPDCIPLKPGETIPERSHLQVPPKDNFPGKPLIPPNTVTQEQKGRSKGYGIFEKNAGICINLGKTIVASAAGSHSLKQAQADFKKHCDSNKQLQAILDQHIKGDIAISPLDWSKLSPP